MTMISSQIDKLITELNSAFEYLPIENSTIAYEIILVTMKFYVDQKELSLKQLFFNNNFTEMGARYHLDRLVKNDWLILDKSENDRRVKIVKPTQNLVNSFKKYYFVHFG